MPDDGTGRGRSLRALGIAFAAAAWGFAEATLFFIVPDVLLTAIAIRAPRLALVCCGCAVAGAVAGGVVMYAWAAADPPGAMAAVGAVPDVSDEMIEQTERELREHGVTAVFIGPVRGTPYKVYAVQAAEVDIPLPLFALASVPARLLCFVLLTLLAAATAKALRRRLGNRALFTIHGAGWLAFYLVFSLRMPG